MQLTHGDRQLEITYNEVTKDIRQMCAKVGVTFKRANHNLNGMAAYVFVSSATGLTIHNGSFNFGDAYYNALAGNVDDWALKNRAGR